MRRASKMRVFSIPGQRLVVTLSSGNLSLTQNALNLLEHRARHTPGERTINNATSLFEVAALVGDALREIRKRDEPYLRSSGIDPSGSFIVGGQIAGEAPRLFLVYSEGNFIESNPDTPWFQTGEIKFGKPATPAGELEVRVDGCGGERIAVLPLAPAAAHYAVTKLPPATIQPRMGKHDLCFTFTQKIIDPLWVLHSVELSSAGGAQGSVQ